MRLRLEEKPVEIDGKTYKLRCNMAILDALEEANGGSIDNLMDLHPRRGACEIMAAMLNDYAEDEGWPADWTARKVSKRFNFAAIQELDVMGIFLRGVSPEEARAVQNTEEPGESGN